MNLSERIETAPAPSEELWREAFTLVHGPKPERLPGGSYALTNWLREFNPFFDLMQAKGWIDSALLLVPWWLVPQLDFTKGTARLVNRLGVPENDNDHASTAASTPIALLASIIKEWETRIR